VRALEVYRNKDIWRDLQKNAMSQDFSWEYSAGEYAKLYRIAMNFMKKEEIQAGIRASHS
jgi:starch synthase